MSAQAPWSARLSFSETKFYKVCLLEKKQTGYQPMILPYVSFPFPFVLWCSIMTPLEPFGGMIIPLPQIGIVCVFFV